MKRILCIFAVLIAISVSVVSCNNDGNENEEKTYLVKTKLTYTVSGISEETNFKYNSLGQLEEKTVYKDSELQSCEEYQYDENGFLVYAKKSSRVTIEIFYTNDNSGRATERREEVTVNGTTAEIVTFVSYPDNNGSYIESTTDTEGNVNEIFYLMDDRGSLSEVKNGSASSVKYTNIYDKNGRLVKVTNNMQSPSWVTEFEYNEDGTLIKESSYDPKGQLISYTEYFYSEDIEAE